jgi:hypothetical protein
MVFHRSLAAAITPLGEFGQRERMAQRRAEIGQRRRPGPSASDALVRYRPIPHDLKKAID